MLAPDNNIKTYNGHFTWWDCAPLLKFSLALLHPRSILQVLQRAVSKKSAMAFPNPCIQDITKMSFLAVQGGAVHMHCGINWRSPLRVMPSHESLTSLPTLLCDAQHMEGAGLHRAAALHHVVHGHADSTTASLGE